MLEIFHYTVIPGVANAFPFFNFNVDPVTYLWVYLMLFILAVIIGVLGSMLAMRRYLKV